ncbi:hypothetical protein [Streptomyces roseolus]|uniref:hypothetical protein n=1 Tax=Streptomyces roseolus TaxID=67358 RepID=UPI0036C1513B
MTDGIMQYIPVGYMGRLGIQVDKYYGRPMDIIALQNTDRVHSILRCPSVAICKEQAGNHRALFNADIASRMCVCCLVKADGPREEGLYEAVIDLVSLRELLDEEAEEERNREDPQYVPDHLGANFNEHHWRTIQSDLTKIVTSLRAHPWLQHWASADLIRAATYAERRCTERRGRIDLAVVERTAATLNDLRRSTPKLAWTWSNWRSREDCSLPSPDDEHYEKVARTHHPDAEATWVEPTVTISVRLPPVRLDSIGLYIGDTLSDWEQDTIAAYKTAADWASGTVTLTAPPVVVRELLCPARNLDLAAVV